MFKSTLKVLGLALPLLFVAGAAKAVPIINATLTIGGVATSATVVGVGNAALMTGADLGFTGGPLVIGASSGAPAGFLQDTQFNFNLPSGSTLNVSVVDTDYVATGTGNFPFATVSNSSSIQNTTVTLESVVDGVTVFNGNLVEGVTGVTDDAVVAFLAGQTYTMSHTYVFTNTGGGNSTVNLTTTTQVPEPSMVALMGAGLLGLGFVGFRRKSL